MMYRKSLTVYLIGRIFSWWIIEYADYQKQIMGTKGLLTDNMLHTLDTIPLLIGMIIVTSHFFFDSQQICKGIGGVNVLIQFSAVIAWSTGMSYDHVSTIVAVAVVVFHFSLASSFIHRARKSGTGKAILYAMGANMLFLAVAHSLFFSVLFIDERGLTFLLELSPRLDMVLAVLYLVRLQLVKDEVQA